MPRHNLVVLTNAVPGRDEEFNAWYTNRHLGDLLKIPGVIAAQRFRLSSLQLPRPPSEFQYLAIYEIETDDLAGFIKEFNARAGTSAMVLSDALADRRLSHLFEPITPRVERPA